MQLCRHFVVSIVVILVVRRCCHLVFVIFVFMHGRSARWAQIWTRHVVVIVVTLVLSSVVSSLVSSVVSVVVSFSSFLSSFFLLPRRVSLEALVLRRRVLFLLR